VKGRGGIIAGILAALALALVGASCAPRIVFERRASEFESRCRASEGKTLAQTDLANAPMFAMGTERGFSYHYGWAGLTSCTYELDGGRLAHLRIVRSNDFDRCTDPVSYPRRHWVCSIARVLVP